MIKENAEYYFIDFDCTLVKSLIPVVDVLNKKYNANVKPEDIKSWNFREIKPDLTDDEIEEIFSVSSFFENLEFYEGAKEFLLSHEDNSIIVTKGKPLNIYNKRIWLDNQGLKNIKMIGLNLEVSKKFVNMQPSSEEKFTIFIDDSTYNLNESNATYKLQFREFGETEWNKNWNGEIINKWI